MTTGNQFYLKWLEYAKVNKLDPPTITLDEYNALKNSFFNGAGELINALQMRGVDVPDDLIAEIVQFKLSQ
jgi:hypothetical protein